MFAHNSNNNDVRLYGWQRNPKWIAMPQAQSNVQRALVNVFDIETSSNVVGLTMSVTGGYTVDWGDGTTENFASGATATHTYDYTSSLWVIDEYTKQALITIYPQTVGNSFSSVRFDASLQSGKLRSAFVEIQVNAPDATTLMFAQNADLFYLECCIIHAIGAITSAQSMFSYCYSLKKVVFPAGSLQSVTTAYQMFYYCRALEYIYLPDNAFVNTTNLNRMFAYCSLKTFEAPVGFGNAATSAEQILAYNYALQYVKFASGSLQNITSITYMFYNSESLRRVDFPSGSLGLVSNASTPFNGCTNIRRVTNLAIPVSFTLNGRFAGAELNEIYTALPTVTGKTITVTGIHGTVDDDPTIATAKGWTVTGS